MTFKLQGVRGCKRSAPNLWCNGIKFWHLRLIFLKEKKNQYFFFYVEKSYFSWDGKSIKNKSSVSLFLTFLMQKIWSRNFFPFLGFHPRKSMMSSWPEATWTEKEPLEKRFFSITLPTLPTGRQKNNLHFSEVAFSDRRGRKGIGTNNRKKFGRLENRFYFEPQVLVWPLKNLNDLNLNYLKIILKTSTSPFPNLHS